MYVSMNVHTNEYMHVYKHVHTYASINRCIGLNTSLYQAKITSNCI